MAKPAEQLDVSLPVGVSAETRHQTKRARQLAEDIGLPFIEFDAPTPEYILMVSDDRLEIHSMLTPPAHGPISVDFVTGKAAHRRLHGGGRNQHIARAIGMKPGYSPRVIDATAGLGADAFVLASLGCRIRMIENCKPIAQLLEDGLLRARGEANIDVIAQRMLLFNGDAIDLIPQLSRRAPADVIYLDPMYPPREKSAAVKKEMQMLQVLADPSANNSALLECALKHALKRVVVKRPGSAEPISEAPPQACVKSPNTRFDIYIPQR
ncbi:MAG: class I SAM-dependent methyltransferase [Pseudomonadota bacterium]